MNVLTDSAFRVTLNFMGSLEMSLDVVGRALKTLIPE